MRRNRLGCLSGTGIIAAFVAVLSIAGYGFASGGVMFSPGGLNAMGGQVLGGVSSHADIAGNCRACHLAPWEAGTMDDRCLACHADIAPQLGDIQTEHGRMMKIDPAAKCRDCHPEHHGPFASLTVLEGWRYPHQMSGFFLDGHQLTAGNEAFKCADCHGSDVTTFEVRTCRSCHGQMDQGFVSNHIGAFGESCLTCHDGIDSFGENFTHDHFPFRLIGRHQGVPCEECHANARSRLDFVIVPQDCFSCHAQDDPHAGTLGNDCASCHSPEGWKPSLFDHNRSAFKLMDAHAKVACEGCHLNGAFKGTPMDCFSCHRQDDPHEDQLGTDCGSCHKSTTWQDVTFDHSRTAFPLAGKHVSVLCTSCHKDLTFKNTPRQCASCHVDVHMGQMGKDCATCHTPVDWLDVKFDHSGTGFPLTGNHRDVSCKSCHANGVYKGTPRNCFACHAADDKHKGQFGTDCETCHNPSGWKNVSFDHSRTAFPLTGSHTNVQCAACHVNGVFKGTPKNCFACHASKDVHKGQFGTDCGSCHTPSSWKNVKFDHSKTGFPLSGSHLNVQCAACHINGVYKGTPKNCFACHAADDKHKGQFGTDCSACHDPSSWKNAKFDHSKTAFPLTGNHQNVQCAACHVNGVYKGTPKNCFACHAAKDKHNGQFGTDCASCHVTSGWKNVNFDHNKTAFPLNGSHMSVQCAACHVNGVFKGTPKNCLACHAARYAHNGQFGTECGACHNTSSWKNATFDHSRTAFPLVGKHANVNCASCRVNGVYKGTPTNCFACHAAKDKHNGQSGTDCGSCHVPTGWSNVTFNHNNTAFPLTGRHANISCSKCHQSGQYKGTPAACAACHSEPVFHAGAFGIECQQCHSTSAWTPAQFNLSHSNIDGKPPLKHHGATCITCHPASVKEFTCLACHDSNNP